jgi:hypothetical protein
MSRVDVNLPLQIAALDASTGREAALRAPPREELQSAPKLPFHCERELGFAAFRPSITTSER